MHDKNWALKQIEQLGYGSIEQVPTGRGNDHLTTLVRIARGETFGGVDFDQAMKIVRAENNAKVGLDPDETRPPKV